MFFTLTNSLSMPPREKLENIREIAVVRINHYKLTPGMTKLDRYLRSTTKHGLKTWCRCLVWKGIQLSYDHATGQYIIQFKTKDENDLAELITYGNTEVSGCNLLRYALDQQY